MLESITTSKTAGAILVAGLAIVLMGATAARADGVTVQQRAQAEMNRGKDYTAAWSAAARAVTPVYSDAQIERATNAARAMNEGKDYRAAWDATRLATDSAYSPDQIAKARRVQEEMLKGRDYAAAYQAGDKVQPTGVPAVRAEPTRAAGREGINTMK